MTSTQPPNILFLFSDQQRWDTLGVLNPHIRTPNLDRLANRGLLCERTFSPSPCACRAGHRFLSGQYPSTHGAAHNQSQLMQDHRPLLSQVLRDRGYYTHMVGKSHLSPCAKDPLSLEFEAAHSQSRVFSTLERAVVWLRTC